MFTVERSNHHSTRRTIGFMHQLITRSDTSIPAVCYACRLWCPCRVTSGYDWTDICQPWGEGERPVLLWCLAVSTDASSNQTYRRTLFIHKTMMLLTAKLVIFCVLWFPKVRYSCTIGEVGNETIFRWRIDLPLTVPKIIVIGHLLLKLLHKM